MTLQGLLLCGRLRPEQQLYMQEAGKMKVFMAALFIIIFFNAVALAQDPPPYRKDSARRLIIRLNSNYLLLDRSLKGLEDEIKKFPDTTLILSAVNKSGEIRLLSIEVWDDLRLIGSHIYTTVENEALAAGGRHELYQSEVREGSRRLRVAYSWTGDGESPQKGEIFIPITISKGMNYFIELSLEQRGKEAGLYYTKFEFGNR